MPLLSTESNGIGYSFTIGGAVFSIRLGYWTSMTLFRVPCSLHVQFGDSGSTRQSPFTMNLYSCRPGANITPISYFPEPSLSFIALPLAFQLLNEPAKNTLDPVSQFMRKVTRFRAADAFVGAFGVVFRVAFGVDLGATLAVDFTAVFVADFLTVDFFALTDKILLNGFV